MNDEVAPLETPDAFLKALGESIRSKEGIDTDLATILTMHILTADPALNAVAEAKDAIVKLASERADLPKRETADG